MTVIVFFGMVLVDVALLFASSFAMASGLYLLGIPLFLLLLFSVIATINFASKA